MFKLVVLISLVFSLFSLYSEERTLSFDEVVLKVISGNYQVLSKKYDVESSKFRAEKSRASYYPALSADASYMRQTGNPVPRPNTTLVKGMNDFDPENKSYNVYNFGISARQLIYDFGRNSSNIDAADLSLKSELLDENIIKSRLVELAYIRYASILTAYEMVGVAEKNRDSAKRHLAQATSFFEAGSRPKIDMVRMESELKNSEAALISAKSQLENFKAELLNLCGENEWYDFSVTPVSEEIFNFEDSFDANLQAALKKREEIEQVKVKIESAESSQKGASRDFYPYLYGTANITEAGVKLDDLRWNWGAGILFSWPIFSGFSSYYASKELNAKTESLKIGAKSIESSIKLEVFAAFSKVKESSARKEALDAALSASKEAAMLADGRYKAGSSPLSELLDAETNLANAMANSVRAQYELFLAKVRLETARGLILEGIKK